jgi:serine/threonine-protein kinase
MALAVGDRIDRYEILGLLGSGGMGEVYCARDPRLERLVALKIVRADGALGPEGSARLLREARAAAALAGPNVVAIYDVGEVTSEGPLHGLPYIAMELVPGKSLRALVGDAAIPLEKRVGWLLDVARTLGAAHRQGIVHRDVKPENVMIAEDGVVKVLDFGIARRLDVHVEAAPGDAAASAGAASVRTLLTRAGTAIGTPAYMAPEQLRGETLDGRADQFAWAVLAYELLTGVRPWSPGSDVLEVEPRPVASVNAAIRPAVAAAIDRALSKDGAARFSSMEEVVAAMAAESSSAPSRSRSRVVGGILLGGVSLLAAFWIGSRRPAATPSIAATPAPAPSTTVVRFSDLPASHTSSVEALAAYKRALELAENVGATPSQDRLDEAIAKDPDFASAHLQRAYRGVSFSAPVDDGTRRSFAKATALRAELTARDGEFLDAIAPTIADPPDYERAVGLLRAMAARRPGDVEVWDALASFLSKSGHWSESIEAYEHERTLDPSSSAGLQIEAALYFQIGREEEGGATLDECVRRSPADVDCRAMAALLAANRGRCEDLDRMGREFVSIAPESSRGYLYRAWAQAHLGGTRETLEQLVAQGESRIPDIAFRTTTADGDALGIADVTGALAEGVRLADVVAAHDGMFLGARLAKIQFLTEMGEVPEATAVAMDLVKRLRAFPEAESPWLDEHWVPVVYAYWGGAIGEAEFRRRRDAWVTAWRRRLTADAWAGMEDLIWTTAWAFPARTKRDGEEALAQDGFGSLPPPMAPQNAMPFAYVGNACRLAGRLAEARPRLDGASRTCFLEANTPLQAALWLGELLEEQGDAAGACAAYTRVAAARAGAKPRSVLGEEARSRAAHLRCAAKP